MSAANPLLSALSNINEIRAFSESLSGGFGASLEITAPVCRAYFIGAVSLNNRLVVVSDNAFVLYHESLGVPSLSCHYRPTMLGVDIVPVFLIVLQQNTFNLWPTIIQMLFLQRVDWIHMSQDQ